MPTQSLHILLVEDNPADARLVQKMLSGQGLLAFDLTCVENLAKAKAHLNEAHADLALLDLGLPDADGLEAASTMLAHRPAIPVVILSGYGDEALALKAMQMGTQDYLPKEALTPDLLVRAIRYAVERHHILKALAEAQQRERQESELKRVEAISTTQSTSITAQLYDAASLHKSLPETFERFAARYSKTLELSLEEQVYRKPAEASAHLQTLAADLGYVRAGPRDVTELHVNALKRTLQSKSSPQAQAYFDEARIVLIELMGHLLSYYRTQSLGLPTYSSSSPSR